jgi:signal transduction histidine kinase
VLTNSLLNGIEDRSKAGDGRSGSISGTGIGLPVEKADQIFSDILHEQPRGSGMGLAIGRATIESHRGRLWATPNDRRGALFHFTQQIANEELKVPAVET